MSWVPSLPFQYIRARMRGTFRRVWSKHLAAFPHLHILLLHIGLNHHYRDHGMGSEILRDIGRTSSLRLEWAAQPWEVHGRDYGRHSMSIYGALCELSFRGFICLNGRSANGVDETARLARIMFFLSRLILSESWWVIKSPFIAWNLSNWLIHDAVYV